MALVNTKKMFKMAYKNGYAIGAFNVNNMEITQGIIAAIAEENALFILRFSSGGRNYARLEYLVRLVEVALETTVKILRLSEGYIANARE